MSPLVALLALACVAPLAVQAKKSEEKCTTSAQGIPTHHVIDIQPSHVIPKEERLVDTDIEDNCSSLPFRELVGVAVTVCDDQEPFVDIPVEPPYSPVTVRRTGNATDATEVYIIQYCRLKIG